MKKIFFFAALMLLVSINCYSSNGFFISQNDTVRVHPNKLDGYHQQVFSMVTDGYCDSWDVRMTYPQGMTVKLVNGITALSGMCVDYMTATGQWTCYEPSLQVSANYATISATTSDRYGFYDYTGTGDYIPYGTVKWVPGERQMFSLNLYLTPDFREGELIMDVTFNSSADSRGPILSNVRAYNRTYIWVGYMPGDVTGDGILTVGDATLIISYLLLDEDERSTYWGNEFSAAAADYDRDGYVSMADVGGIIRSALIQHID